MAKLESIILEIEKNIPNYPEIIQNTKQKKFTWKGLNLLKDPMTLTIYQQLIQDIKPKTIIEFGSGDGGSALWFKDLCNSLNINTKIISFDKYDIPNFNGINFINYDINNIENYSFEKYESPKIIIEDCHTNMLGIVKSVDNLLEDNDYLIIEDTIDPKKYAALSAIDFNSFNLYKDSYYCDFWGKNNSWNFDSIFKKFIYGKKWLNKSL